MTVLKCIAVDDEPLALKLVETFIEQTPFLELITTCDNAVEAMGIIRDTKPDVVFLDINMPNLTGMELARLLQDQPGPLPKIVFTTAYNHYAPITGLIPHCYGDGEMNMKDSGKEASKAPVMTGFIRIIKK